MSTYNFFIILVSVSVFVNGNRTHRSTHSKIESLTKCLKQKGSQISVLVTRESNQIEYDKLNDQTNSVLPFVRPLAFLAVNNVKDVSNSVTCTQKLNIHFVVMAGAHSYAKYSFGDNSSVVIDLHKLTKVKVHASAKTASVEPGVLLAQLYYGVWSQGEFGVSAGICLTVGMGQPLGGGHGYFQKTNGVTSDNIVGFEMVDASGKLRTVNKNENAELYWALRGGGTGNFGIVTSLKFRLFDAKNLKVRSILFSYSLSQFAGVFKAWDIWNEATKMDSVFSDLTATSDGVDLLIVDFENKMNELSIKKLIQIFPERTTVPPIVRLDNFIDFVAFNVYSGVNVTRVEQLVGVKRTDRDKNTFQVKSYFVAKTLGRHEIEELSSFITRMPAGIEWALESFGGAVNRIPRNATAYSHRNSLYNIEFKTFSSGAMNRKFVREFDTFILRAMDNGESYQNYADWELTDYLERYYGHNLPRLVKIKREVDPENIFNFPQSIPIRY